MSRLLVGLALLVVIQAAVLWIRRERQPDSIQALSEDLAQLPLRLGTWTGHDEPIDPRLFEAIRAASTVNRVYQEDVTGRVAMQVAVFSGDYLGLPHNPQSCYTKVGWAIQEQKEIWLRAGPQDSRLAHLLVFEQEGQRIHVMYWYQFGETNVMDYDSLRRERWKLFGQRVWPPLIKVMIQTDISETGHAAAQLTTFGELVLGWTKDLIRTEKATDEPPAVAAMPAG